MVEKLSESQSAGSTEFLLIARGMISAVFFLPFPSNCARNSSRVRDSYRISLIRAYWPLFGLCGNRKHWSVSRNPAGIFPLQSCPTDQIRLGWYFVQHMPMCKALRWHWGGIYNGYKVFFACGLTLEEKSLCSSSSHYHFVSVANSDRICWQLDISSGKFYWRGNRGKKACLKVWIAGILFLTASHEGFRRGRNGVFKINKEVVWASAGLDLNFWVVEVWVLISALILWVKASGAFFLQTRDTFTAIEISLAALGLSILH